MSDLSQGPLGTPTAQKTAFGSGSYPDLRGLARGLGTGVALCIGR